MTRVDGVGSGIHPVVVRDRDGSRGSTPGQALVLPNYPPRNEDSKINDLTQDFETQTKPNVKAVPK